MSLPSPSEIFVRAYTEKPGEAPLGAKPIGNREDQPSPWSLMHRSQRRLIHTSGEDHPRITSRSRFHPSNRITRSRWGKRSAENPAHP